MKALSHTESVLNRLFLAVMRYREGLADGSHAGDTLLKDAMIEARDLLGKKLEDI